MNTKKSKKNNLDDLKEQVVQLEESWKRALADYQNLEKRITQEKNDFCQWANAKLIDKLLPVIDSLEKAVEHHHSQGLDLVYQQFQTVLKSEGVVELTVIGKKFDPATMDAAEMVKGKKDIVVNVICKGYLLNDKILRPAKVKVGKGN